MTTEQLTDGYYIFAGTANGNYTSIDNPVFAIREGVLELVASSASSNSLWLYDEETHELQSNGRNSSGMVANLASKIGWTSEKASYEQGVSIDKEMILAKIYPLSD